MSVRNSVKKIRLERWASLLWWVSIFTVYQHHLERFFKNTDGHPGTPPEILIYLD